MRAFLVLVQKQGVESNAPASKSIVNSPKGTTSNLRQNILPLLSMSHAHLTRKPKTNLYLIKLQKPPVVSTVPRLFKSPKLEVCSETREKLLTATPCKIKTKVI